MRLKIAFQKCVVRMTVFVAVSASVICHGDLPDAQIVDFELQDSGGKVHRLSEMASSPVVVLAFLGTDCPLVHRYSVRLQKIADDYAARGVAVLGINSNRQDSIAEITAFARDTAIEFPVLKDVGNKLADVVGAERTPEVVVLDKKRQVVYRGRIDDQFGVGYSRDHIRESWLTDAIDAVLAGDEPKEQLIPAEGCIIGRVRQPDLGSHVTYSSHIAAIMNRHCVSCHREGEIGPFTLTDYEDVAGWADMIREVVRERRMPPWHADPDVGHFANARGMSDEEKQLIHEWAIAGAPAGDMKNLPKLVQKEDKEWHLGRAPDMVVTMDRTFTVPADGVVEYKYRNGDHAFKEDRWLKYAEIIPGRREVVHHVLAFVRKPGNRDENPIAGGGSFLAAYVPGLISEEFPDGMAKFIPAGSTLAFQLHYTPNGVEQTDETKIGLYFANAEDVDSVVVTREARNSRFRIPPKIPAHPVESRSASSPVPVQLLGMMPHMHVRGRSFRYTAVSSDMSELPLLNVPEYDFNWQTSYRLAEPLKLSPGTYIQCYATFDNSAGNLNNPDPDRAVGWGDQTTDEMMIGYFDVAIPRDVVQSGKVRSEAVTRLLGRYDENGDDLLQRDEVPAEFNRIFERLDKNDDGELTPEELKALSRR